MENVWVVGVNKGESEIGTVWELQSICSTKEKAEMMCVGHSHWFVGPVCIDEELPIETLIWPGCYYPDSHHNSPVV